MLKYGVPQKLMNLMHSDIEDIANRSVVTIGTMMEDSHITRDHLLKHGIAENLLKLCKSGYPNLEQISNLVYFITMDLDDHPLPGYTSQGLLPVYSFLLEQPDDTIQNITLQSLGYLSVTGRVSLGSEVAKSLVKILKSDDFEFHHFVLQILSFPVEEGFVDITRAMNNDTAEELIQLLPHFVKQPNKVKQKAAILVVDKLLKISKELVTLIFDSGVFPLIMNFVELSTDIRVQTETLVALANGFHFGTPDQIATLVNHNITTLFCKILLKVEAEGDEPAIPLIIHAYNLCLRKTNDHQDVRKKMFDELKSCGGMEAITRLRNHTDTETAKLAYKVSTVIGIMTSDKPPLSDNPRSPDHAEL